MTVGTKNFEIVEIGAPVFDAARPRPLTAFRPNLGININMVQLQNPYVISPASGACPTERRNDCRAGCPICLLLSACVQLSLARLRTIPRFGGLAAVHALPAVTPPLGGVATGRAILGVCCTSTARLDIKGRAANCTRAMLSGLLSIGGEAAKALVPPRRPVSTRTLRRAIFSARAAGECYAALGASVMNWFHSITLACENAVGNYFDIACRRVEAEARAPRFDLAPPAPTPTQESLL